MCVGDDSRSSVRRPGSPRAGPTHAGRAVPAAGPGHRRAATAARGRGQDPAPPGAGAARLRRAGGVPAAAERRRGPLRDHPPGVAVFVRLQAVPVRPPDGLLPGAAGEWGGQWSAS